MDDWTSSAKIDKLCEILELIRGNDPFEKVIVFSQFTGFLDIIQPALEARGFGFGRVSRWRLYVNVSTMGR